MNKSKIYILFIIIILFLALFFNNAFAKDCFVNQSSSKASDTYTRDTNSEAAPWKTIQRGLDCVIAGDTLIISGGPYTGQSWLAFPNAGTQSNPITIRGKSGDNVVINGVSGMSPIFAITKNNVNNGTKWITGKAEWINIENLTFQSPAQYTIRIFNTSNIKINNCRFSGVAGTFNENPASIYIFFNNPYDTSNVTITNCDIGNNPEGHGIILFMHGPGMVIKNNYIHDLNRHVTYCGSTSHNHEGIGVFVKHKGQGSVVVENNAITNTYYGIYMNSSDSSIKNNLVWNCDIGIRGNGGMGSCNTQAFQRNTIMNNTIANCSQMGLFLAKYEDGCTISGGSGAYANIVKNNIFYKNGTSDSNVHTKNLCIYDYPSGATGHGTTLDYNIYYQTSAGTMQVAEYNVGYTLSGWRVKYGQDAHSTDSAPAFAGGASPNTISGFALTSGNSGIGVAASQVGIQTGTPPSTPPSPPTGVKARLK